MYEIRTSYVHCLYNVLNQNFICTLSIYCMKSGLYMHTVYTLYEIRTSYAHCLYNVYQDFTCTLAIYCMTSELDMHTLYILYEIRTSYVHCLYIVWNHDFICTLFIYCMISGLHMHTIVIMNKFLWRVITFATWSRLADRLGASVDCGPDWPIVLEPALTVVQLWPWIT